MPRLAGLCSVAQDSRPGSGERLRLSRRYYRWVRVHIGAGRDAPATDPTCCCGPNGGVHGTTKLICVTRTRPGGIPINWKVVTGTPPIVMVMAWRGLGAFDIEEGVLPVASDGVTCPSPVMNRVYVPPRTPVL